MTDEYRALAHVLTDLDRCPHGRHRGDICSGVPGCDGPSRGNPHLPAPGEVVGYDIGGRPYVVPTGHLSTGRAKNWRPPRLPHVPHPDTRLCVHCGALIRDRDRGRECAYAPPVKPVDVPGDRP